MNKLFIALSLMGLATTSFAYNGQVEGGYTFRDFDSNAVDTSGLFELKGTFYFENVNSKGPLNEAAFLGHNSNVYLGYGYDFTKFNPVLGQSTKYETNLLSAGIEYFVDQFYVNAELGYGQDSVKPPKKTMIFLPTERLRVICQFQTCSWQQGLMVTIAIFQTQMTPVLQSKQNMSHQLVMATRLT